MTMWLLFSVLILVTLALSATVYLFLSLKRQAWESALHASARYDQLRADQKRLESAFDEIKRAFMDLEGKTGMLVAPVPTRSGLNISRRTQAIRMLRRGDDVKQISAALDLPENEVALLEKVRHLANAAPPGAAQG